MFRLAFIVGLLWAGVALAQSNTPAAVNGAVYNATPPTLTDQQTVPFQADVNGKLLVSSSGGATSLTQPVTLSGFTNTDVWFTDGTTIGQDSGFLYNKTTKTLTLGTLPITGSTNTIKFGLDSATPQGLSVDVSDPLAGNANVAGAKITVFGGRTTGNGAPGVIDFQLGGIGTVGGTTVNGFFDAMVLSSTVNGQALLSIPTGAVSINGAAPGGNALAVAGTAGFNSNVTAGAFISSAFRTASDVTTAGYIWGALNDLEITRIAANIFGMCGPDVAAPAACTLQFPGVATGTSNTAGPNTTINLPVGTGTGAGGSLIVRGAFPGTSGSTPNARSTIFTLDAMGNLTLAQNLGAGGSVFAGGSQQIGWTGSSSMLAPSNGVIRLSNSAVTGFTRLDFGGTTSSFPAIGVSGTGLVVQLADASANAALTALTLRAGGFTVSALPAAGTQGRQAYVTDAVACTFLASLTGGSTTFCPVIDNGTAWVGG